MPLLDSIITALTALLNSAFTVFVAFIFGVIFGIFVKGLTRVILSIILALAFLALLVMFFDGQRLSSIISAAIGIATLVFGFLIRRINHTRKADSQKAIKIDR